LHKALASRVPAHAIHYNKRLVDLRPYEGDGTVRLTFQDSTEHTADLVVGADGIRSMVRRVAFPDYGIRFNGVTAYRAVLPPKAVPDIPGFKVETNAWYLLGLFFFFVPIDEPAKEEGQSCEVVVKTVTMNPEEEKNRISKGVKVSNKAVEEVFSVSIPSHCGSTADLFHR
jgi:salicylate hydroxylase